MRAVAAKREKVEERARKPKKIERFLVERPIPAVRGPDEAFYIVDHHHLSLALWQSRVSTAFVTIIDDYSRLPRSRFWEEMEEEGLLYPFDEKGRRIHPTHLPRAIVALRADPFRDLAWSVRENGGFRKTRVPFAEFRWAEFFRHEIPQRLVTNDYDKAVSRAHKLARSDAARGLPGAVRR